MTEEGKKLKVGDKMPDGTIFAGISPDKNEPMYVTAEDVPISMDFNEAAKYAKNLEAHGHKDWRVPTEAELNMLFLYKNSGALKGTFNLTGSNIVGCYWSSTPYDGSDTRRAWNKRFSDGILNTRGKDYDSSVRCVRG